MPRREKVKAKAKGRKRRSSGSYISEENHAPAPEGIVQRTLNRLHNLGNQIFAISPFSQHFSRWLIDLRVVLSEFESSPNLNMDDQFVKERSQILSNVELRLKELRRRETSGEEAFKSLSDNRLLLVRIEEDYTTGKKEIEERKRTEIKRLSSNVDSLKEELELIARTKTGIFRAISKKAKAQKEAEATQRLNSAQGELAFAVQHFAAEQENLRDEYEKKKQPLIKQMRDHQKEIESQEIDGSLEARRAACEALVNATNALLQRQSVRFNRTIS
jgi:hypothetical protein